jgi:tetratricopeptide (TPR) repeat protein
MFRFPAAGAAFFLLTLTPLVHAQDGQDSEGPWKNLFMQALNAAGTKDYPKADQIFQKALQEAEGFGANDSRVGTTLNAIGLVFRAEKKFAEAEAAYRRALAVLEKTYGSDAIDIANVNFNIASVMVDQDHQSSALPFLRATLPTYESLLGNTSLKTAATLCMMGDSLRLAKDFSQAEGPLRRCASIREADGGMQNTELADAVHSLALTYVGEGKYVLAEPRFKLAEKIRENMLGITSPLLAQTMEDHAALLKAMGRDQQADKLLVIASAIRRNQKKPN